MKTCFYIFICFLIIATDCAYAEISVDFSHQRGFHNESFDLEIKTFGYNVSARYTLDGSEPTSKYGTVPSNSSSFKIPNINSSTVVRVYAYNIEEDVSDAHTYIFTADVFNQNNNTVINEHNYPVEWGYGTSLFGSIACSTQAADYEMTLDDCRENNAAYIEELEAGLKEIPTISISLDKDQVFGPDSGIYVFPVEKPDTCYTLPKNVHSWERQASVEIFNNGQENDLQINAGLQISGASTRYFDFYKHSFKLKFRSEYGKSKLTYPLFEDNTSKKIESLQLRMLGHSTPHDWVSNRREETQFHKDNWARNIQKELSGYGTDSKFFHLFINGLYWGLYDVSERPDADYMAENYGGMPEDYDVIKLLEVKSGTDSAYNYMHDLGHLIYDTIKTISSVNPFTGQNVYNIDIVPNKEKAINFYNETKELLDIEKFIDYNLFNLYVVNTDWKENNWWVARNAKQNEKFKFFVWDAEIILNDAGKSNQVLLYAGNTGVNLKYHPIDLNQRLLDVPEYKIKFGDHIQCNCVEEDGILNPKNLIESYKSSAEKIHFASMLEFARWGDARKLDSRYELICHDVVRETTKKYELEVFPNLLKEMLAVYGRPGSGYELFPNYVKKVRSNGEYVFKEIFNFKAVKFPQLGGEVPDKYKLELTNLNSLGEIYYTTDGTDPRNIDGTISSTAIKYTTPIEINTYKIIKARVYTKTFSYDDLGPKTINNLWTAMCPREFFPMGYYDDLVINEIHYNPADSVTSSGSNLEFLEIKNTGDSELIVSNTEFTDGIEYQFPLGTKVSSNGFILLASDSIAVKNKYNVTVDGQYEGKLANSGELIVFSRPDGGEIDQVHYDDTPIWSEKADGEGTSLSLYLDQTDTENNHLPESWGSSADGSTPGAENVFCMPIIFDITATNPSCHEGNDGFININVSGGTQPITLEWLNSNNNSNLLKNLTSGTYEAIVTDNQNCSETKKITINDPQPIKSNLEIVHATSANSEDGYASVNPSNLFHGHTVEWSNGTNGNINKNLVPGNEYWVTITDVSNINCSVTETFTIEIATSCTIPKNVSAIPTSEQGAIISWSGNSDNTGYDVSYRVLGENSWNTVTTILPNLVLNNLKECATYEYKLNASCNSTKSNSSIIKTFTTAGCNYDCSKSTVNGNVINITNYSAFILWDIIPNATYRLNYRKNGVSEWSKYETSLNFSILFGLDNCSNYEWYIDVICKEGNINSNTINNFTTVDCFRKSGDLNANQEQSSIGNFNFNLYPNPAQDFIKIISNDTGHLSESQILVYDYSGRLVKNGGSFINQITLNLEDLKSGMYIAQIVNQNQSTQYKFRIE